MNYEFEIIDKSFGYQGFFKLEIYRLRHQLFGGGWTGEVRRECLERGHAVGVLPYDPVTDQVVLIEQFRVGALARPSGPWLLEIVAGIIGPGETKLEVARRETQEEIGRELLDSIPICDYLLSSGGCSESLTLYCGRVDASGAGGVHGLADEHEDIRSHVMSRTDALDLLSQGCIQSATPIIALQWLALHHEDVRRQWEPV